MTRIASLAFLLFASTLPLCAQTPTPQSSNRQPTLKITSRAVLVDVIVTDSSGKPVTGLSKEAFAVTEQGKPQTISFFEENGTRPVQPAEMPKLPPDVFSNFSPFPQPPAVNVLLMDSLNTAMTYQVYMHSQVKKFLDDTKSGTRSAIFAMGMNLRLIQGFTDDPAVLVAALENKKNIEVETPTMMKLKSEQDAQQGLIGMMSQQVDSHGSTEAPPAMSGSLQNFINENDSSRTSDRMLLTLANLKRLAAFLQGVPGRKNIIWFAQKVPAVFNVEGGQLQLGNPAVGDEIKKTLAILADERAAIYTVSPREIQAPFETKDTVDDPAQDKDRLSDQLNAEILAEDSGGRAFANTNGIADVIDKITSDGSHFYTLSYTPTNRKMDGGWRKIGVKVAGGKYQLSYRRGYFAVDTTSPGHSKKSGKTKARVAAAEESGKADPLLSQMILGMPQSEQILYKVRVVPDVAKENESSEKKDKSHYQVDFAVDLQDVRLKLDRDGVRKGTLVVSLIVYDRYGHIISNENHLAALDIKPDVYARYQNTGVQLHADIVTPKGNYWLRTGIYDENSGKVGTLEIPLAVVKPVDTASQAAKKTQP